MFSKSSIRTRFLFQLLVASAALIFIFSSTLYLLISNSILDDKRQELLSVANNAIQHLSINYDISDTIDPILDLEVTLVTHKNLEPEAQFYDIKRGDAYYLQLLFPYSSESNSSFLQITKEITTTHKLLDKILRSILFINIIGFIVVILYAIALSKMLILPITTLTRKLSNMNQHLMEPLKTKELPIEFEQLGEMLNRLINRIQNFTKYQKELFIGAAHELKTPLAVIKLKNQVTLMKERQSQEYIDAIKTTDRSVIEMNKIISDILNIGRQEGAQLEKPEHVDIIALLKLKYNDFLLLAKSEKKELSASFEPDSFMATLQKTLLNQIIQNFLQNALKFTPEYGVISLRTYLTSEGLMIEVFDTGCGIDDKVDLFAPFKRQGNKSGVGLGLFLAKSASDALGADISIKNREDGISGTIASLHLRSKLCCPLP